jgi:NAD(P)-dependent dehydrogenase (short-subunit alcohol dehydrogenase family)
MVGTKISFEGQSVVVTGAGRGIGRGYALEFAKRGAAVVVADIASAEDVVAEITANGGRAVAAAVSVNTPAGGQEIIDIATENFGTVDVVVANAGSLNVAADSTDLSADDIEALYATHLMGTWWVTQPAWRLMREKDYGRIIMTGSTAGMFAQSGMAHYGSAKGGIWGLMKSMAHEAERTNIRVNLILPSAATQGGKDAARDLVARGIDIHDYMYGDQKANFDALMAWPDRTDPSVNAPLVAYLASKECQLNGEGFMNMFGHYARAFVGVAEGWVAPDVNEVTAEVIREHLDEIRDISTFATPKYNGDAMGMTADRLKQLS